MPQQTNLTVSYSVGISRNIGDFSNAKTMAEESESWDVSDLDEVGVELLASSIRSRLTAKLDKIVEDQDRRWLGK